MNSYNFPTKDFNKRQNPVKLTRREVLTIDYSTAPSLLAWFGASAIHPLFANLVVGLSIRNSISVIISISILVSASEFSYSSAAYSSSPNAMTVNIRSNGMFA